VIASGLTFGEDFVVAFHCLGMEAADVETLKVTVDPIFLGENKSVRLSNFVLESWDSNRRILKLKGHFRLSVMTEKNATIMRQTLIAPLMATFRSRISPNKIVHCKLSVPVRGVSNIPSGSPKCSSVVSEMFRVRPGEHLDFTVGFPCSGVSSLPEDSILVSSHYSSGVKMEISKVGRSVYALDRPHTSPEKGIIVKGSLDVPGNDIEDHYFRVIQVRIVVSHNAPDIILSIPVYLPGPIEFSEDEYPVLVEEADGTEYFKIQRKNAAPLEPSEHASVVDATAANSSEVNQEDRHSSPALPHFDDDRDLDDYDWNVEASDAVDADFGGDDDFAEKYSDIPSVIDVIDVDDYDLNVEDPYAVPAVWENPVEEDVLPFAPFVNHGTDAAEVDGLAPELDDVETTDDVARSFDDKTAIDSEEEKAKDEGVQNNADSIGKAPNDVDSDVTGAVPLVKPEADAISKSPAAETPAPPASPTHDALPEALSDQKSDAVVSDDGHDKTLSHSEATHADAQSTEGQAKDAEDRTQSETGGAEVKEGNIGADSKATPEALTSVVTM